MQVTIIEGEHSATLSTFIKLLFAIKTFILSILSGHLRKDLMFIHTTARLAKG